LSLLSKSKKNFSSNFKRYNLIIRAVNFCKTFCTCSLSSLGQDPMVESAKKWKRNSFWLLELKMADLERFLIL
jgi:hypothetical protein